MIIVSYYPVLQLPASAANNPADFHNQNPVSRKPLIKLQILNNKYLKYVQPLHLEDSDEVVWEYTLTQSKVTDCIAVHIGSHILSLMRIVSTRRNV